MKNKLKLCLKSFGYRELDNQTLAKPIAFVIITVKIFDDKAIFRLLFRQCNTQETLQWTSNELIFNTEMFENNKLLSSHIANIEFQMLTSYGVLYEGITGEPWNFQLPTDLIL
jgi:hypothetical protein